LRVKVQPTLLPTYGIITASCYYFREQEELMADKKKNDAKERVLNMVKEHDIKFIRLWFTDILGFLKNFAITVEELEGALEEGMGFDGSSIEGYDSAARPRHFSYAALAVPGAHCRGAHVLRYPSTGRRAV
jgi:hypothetical protein